MSFRKSVFLSLLGVLLLLPVFGASGQSIGSIRGTVTDPSRSVVAGASIVLTETNTQISRTVSSNENGIFVFPDLPIGSYALKVTARGFETQNRPALTLLTGQVIDLTI